jgi:hypothetical protein
MADEGDPVAKAELARRIAPRATPQPLPQTTRELLARLPSSLPELQPLTIEALVRELGNKMDRELWSQIHGIVCAVSQGLLDVRHLLSAYDQALKPGIKKRGAKFWAALQCLARIDGVEVSMLSRPRGR